MAKQKANPGIITLCISVLLTGMIISACVEKIDLNITDSGNLMSVEGRITDIDSCYIILRRTATKLSAPQYIPISDARVSVIENGHISIPFRYLPGESVYMPVNREFRGKKGNTYQLKIEMGNGSTYLSSVDTLQPASVIKRIEEQFAVDESGLVPYPQINVHAIVARSEASASYLHFQFVHYARAKYCAACVIYSKYDLIDNSNCPSPFKSCTQTLREEYLLNQAYDFYGFPCINPNGCWNYVKSRNYKLFNDTYVPVNTDYDVLFGKVPYTTFSKYFLELHVTRLTKAAHKYFTDLEQMGIKSGSMFDPVPVLLTGNVYNEKDPKDRALGYFVVGGQEVTGKMINRGEIGSGPLSPKRDDDVEFKEFINSDAPRLYCNFLPQARCVITNFRTDKRPVGWVD